MRRILLAIDLSNQAYRFSAAYPTLSSDDRFTGGLYGFMAGISKIIHIVGATDIVVCEDRKPYLRSDLYPQYKQLRKKNEDKELYERAQFSITLIKELLQVLGWPLWSLPGFESDDLISHAVIKYRHRYDQVIAASNDSDLYQLFKWPVFALYKGKKGLYTHKHYAEEWGDLPPDDLKMALAFIGTHNDVEGVRGVGEVTARKIVQDPTRLRLFREQHREIVERNLELIQLPHPKFPRATPLPGPTRRYVERDLIRFCGRFDIGVTMTMCQAFERIRTK